MKSEFSLSFEAVELSSILDKVVELEIKSDMNTTQVNHLYRKKVFNLFISMIKMSIQCGLANQ